MNYESISNEICHLAEQANIWSSTITIPQGDKYLDISSAAMGKLSTTPTGASNQPLTFPKGKSASVYRFDPEIFNENSWPKLKKMLTKVGCVSGCRLTVSHADTRKTCNCLAAYTLRCTHGYLFRNKGASTFEEGDVGPSNVVTEFIKRVKTKGATKGKFAMYGFVYTTSYINAISSKQIHIYDFELFSIRNGFNEIEVNKKNHH
jgi:hypothetical protein